MYINIEKTIPFVALLACFLLLGCSKSDDQKEFENQAFSGPDGNFTEMSANGSISGHEDPEDWRIAPMYQGLIEVETPPYPNPVALNGQLRLQMYLRGIDSVPGIEIFVLSEANNPYGPIEQFDQSQLDNGYKVFVLDPSTFSGANPSQNAAGLNRIIIFDGRNNVITYGDVRVE